MLKKNKSFLDIFLYRVLFGVLAAVIATFGISEFQAYAENKMSDQVAATVNGVPIYKREIDVCMPKNSFGAFLEYRRESKLDSLIYVAIVKQFLDKEKIRIEDQRVDMRIEHLRKNPPTSSCSCCPYSSLEQFMRINDYTMNDLREETRINMGLDSYMDRLWQLEYQTEEQCSALVEKNRQRLKEQYINVSHIFFSTSQDPKFYVDPDLAQHRVMKKAESAFKRLKKGENFETLAKEISEDMVSRKNGGKLGCIKKNAYGLKFSNAATKLSPGQFSHPVNALNGTHIIKRNEVTDKNILTILKNQFIHRKKKEIIGKLKNEATIVRYDKKK